MRGLYELSSNKQVRAEYEMRQKAWRDRASRNDGFYQNGIQKGEQNKAAAVARKALAEGMAVELISKITGLDPETIRGL